MKSAERVLAGRIGAHERWARESDRTAATAPARQAFADRFEREVDPTNTLPPAERAIRAAHAKKAYFLRLSLASAQARRAPPTRTGKKLPGLVTSEPGIGLEDRDVQDRARPSTA